MLMFGDTSSIGGLFLRNEGTLIFHVLATPVELLQRMPQPSLRRARPSRTVIFTALDSGETADA
jgi:hypothetical protein